jgi:uncharacterized protein DUF4326
VRADQDIQPACVTGIGVNDVTIPILVKYAQAGLFALHMVGLARLVERCVDRTSRWGNPFEIGRDGTGEEVIQKYRDWFLTGTEPRKIGRYIALTREGFAITSTSWENSTSRAVGPGCRATLIFYSNKRTNLNRHCKVPQKPDYPYGSGFP